MSLSELIDVLEKGTDIARDFFRNRKADQVYLWLAPWLFLALTILFEKTSPFVSVAVVTWMEGSEAKTLITMASLGAALAQPLEILLSWILAIVLSNGMVQQLEKILELSKYTAYEKHARHYYLKGSCVLYREAFRLPFSSGTLDAILILAAFACSYLLRDELPFLDGLPYGIACFLGWGELKWEYLSGNTLKEAERTLQTEGAKRGLPLDALHGDLGRALGSARLCDTVRSNPTPYGIHYPDVGGPPEYLELFHAMMREENILVENCFYREWREAFILPVNAMLLRDKKVIIFVGANMDAGKMHQWVQDYLDKMLGIRNAWRICLWGGMADEFDIAVVPYDKIPEFVPWIRWGQFAACGVMQVVFEPAAGLVEQQCLMESYADYFRERGIPVCWCFADRYVDGLLDFLSHTFRAAIRRLETAASLCRDIYLCTVKARDEAMAGEWMREGCPDSAAMVIFKRLLEEGEREISFVSSQASAVRDFCMQAQRLLSAETEVMSFCTSLWDLERRDRRILLADDEYFNYYDLYQYISQPCAAFCGAFLLEENHLFLDFMLDFEKEYLGRKGFLPTWYPIYQDTARNRILRIVRVAGDESRRKDPVVIPASRVRELFPEWIDADEREIETWLNQLTDMFFSWKDRAFSHRHSQYLVSGAFLHASRWLWQEVWVIDEARKQQRLGSMLYCQLYQRWLEGELISRDGYCYRIGDVREGAKGHEIPLARSHSFWERKRPYLQERDYEVTDAFAYETRRIKQGILLEKCTAEIRVRTSGWQVRAWDGTVEDRRDCAVPQRAYRHKNILFLHLANSGTNERELLRLLAELLEESAKTLYPYHCHYLWFEAKEGFPVLARKATETTDPTEMDGILIVEDAVDDIGLLESLTERLEDWLALLLGYCRWKAARTQGSALQTQSQALRPSGAHP